MQSKSTVKSSKNTVQTLLQCKNVAYDIKTVKNVNFLNIQYQNVRSKTLPILMVEFEKKDEYGQLHSFTMI